MFDIYFCWLKVRAHCLLINNQTKNTLTYNYVMSCYGLDVPTYWDLSLLVKVDISQPKHLLQDYKRDDK